MRVVRGAPRGFLDTHGVEQFDSPPVGRLPAGQAVHDQHLGDLVADLLQRVEGAERICGTNPMDVPRSARHSPRGQSGDLDAGDRDVAPGDATVRGQQALDGARDGGLARSGLADHGDHAARLDLQGYPRTTGRTPDRVVYSMSSPETDSNTGELMSTDLLSDEVGEPGRTHHGQHDGHRGEVHQAGCGVDVVAALGDLAVPIRGPVAGRRNRGSSARRWPGWRCRTAGPPATAQPSRSWAA